MPSARNTSHINGAVVNTTFRFSGDIPAVKKRGPRLVEKDDNILNNKAVYDFFYGFLSISCLVLGITFCFVPLYKLYCSSAGVGFDSKYVSRESSDDAGVSIDKKGKEVFHKSEKEARKRIMKVHFQGNTGSSMPIAFLPLQQTIETLVGEPCLAFYAAYNKTDKTIHGISSYNIAPHDAMPYLNKIQCFCFEEQRFKPHELVEMPVFFYFQKEILDDPLMAPVQETILSYTFFNLERNRDLIRSF